MKFLGKMLKLSALAGVFYALFNKEARQKIQSGLKEIKKEVDKEISKNSNEQE